MFIGHFAVALAAKKAAPRVSLGTLAIAAQFIDLLWPVLLLLGLEHVRINPGDTAVTPLDFYDYPWSHSLAAVAGWAAIGGLAFYAIRREVRGAAVIAACVTSHWLLDLITHRPDLPLAPGSSTVVGLGLWNSLAGTVIVELSIFVLGVFLYLRSSSARDRVGVTAFWSLVVFLLAVWLANLLGPPPPAEHVIALAGNSTWLLILWAYWIDSHRTAAGAAHAPSA